jgi:hypothetical protein
MSADIDAVYKKATPQQARAVCRQYGIQYLVSNIYDPAWQDKQGWVWTLNPVASDPEFRALDCRQTANVTEVSDASTHPPSTPTHPSRAYVKLTIIVPSLSIQNTQRAASLENCASGLGYRI